MINVSKLSSLAPAFAIAVGLMAPSTGYAADILVEPPVFEAPEVIVESKAGWYLRGDVSYDFHESKGAIYYPAMDPYTNHSVDDSFNLGIGIGYQINDHFRVDATADYVFAADWRGSTRDGNFVCPDTVDGAGNPVAPNTPGQCISSDTATVSMFKIMGNAYWDIGWFHGFAPYVGAGIGGAYVKYHDYVQVDQSYDPCCNPIGGTIRRDHPAEASWRFAYALHAGVAYKLNHSWMVDVGYTYSDISGGPIAQDIYGTAPQAYDQGFEEHVIRAGLRYKLW